jgi:Aldo/keto reductase family
VQMGKVRYIGASSMYAYQFLGYQHVAEVHGWTKFISMQNYYNLIYREEEREMLPACKELGVGYRNPRLFKLTAVSFLGLLLRKVHLQDLAVKRP